MTEENPIFIIMEALDENKENIKTGDYLKISNALQQIYNREEKTKKVKANDETPEKILVFVCSCICGVLIYVIHG